VCDPSVGHPKLPKAARSSLNLHHARDLTKPADQFQIATHFETVLKSNVERQEAIVGRVRMDEYKDDG
jgi:hypothetical protein